MILYCLSASPMRYPQTYIGLKVGAEELYRSFKNATVWNNGQKTNFSCDGGTKEFIKTLYCSTRPFIGLALGRSFPMGASWNLMLEGASQLTGRSSVNSGLKVLLRHEAGLFFGAGLEHDYSWAIYQQVRSNFGNEKDAPFSARLKVNNNKGGDFGVDYPSFKKHKFYPFISLGYQLQLKNNYALQFEVQGLASNGYTTTSNILLPSKGDGLQRGSDKSLINSRIQYGAHIKLRAMMTFVKFFG